jgi:riboflavin kinase/FMN adenylyltransferase
MVATSDDPSAIERSWPFAAVFAGGLAHPVIAIGNFDGVHLGHRAVIAEAMALAGSIGRPCVALTFEPHPRSVFQPDSPVFRLTPWPQKAELLKAAGCAATLAIRFDRAFAALTADQFIDDLLIDACGASGVVVGFDFHFGKGRAGNPEIMRARLNARDVPCRIADPLCLGTEVVSSSAIRAALEAGDVVHAAALLGRPWSVCAVVQHGDKRGRELGFPTANLHLTEDCRLAYGIYAVRARVAGVTHDAIASFGRRPTFDDGAPKLEVMLFDFAGEIYGQVMEVSFIGWIRGEARFDGVDALIAQMHRDCDAARALLEARS